MIDEFTAVLSPAEDELLLLCFFIVVVDVWAVDIVDDELGTWLVVVDSTMEEVDVGVS